ncbi:MAG: Regulatory protein [Acidimicrobiales bacterium]|nr:Regulatory protein [Acidimicrobiales bacterium]
MPNQLVHFTASTAADLRGIREGLGDVLRRRGFGDVRVGDAVLMVSELITNALVHAHSTAEISVDREGAGVRVAVTDQSPARPVVRPADPRRVGGNGMRIVEALSDTWGTISHANAGKEVWFRLGT